MIPKDKKIIEYFENKSRCPECLTQCSVEELEMFGGLCEECSVAFDD